MPISVHENEIPKVPMPGHTTRKLIDEKNGAVKGYCIGVTEYTAEEFPSTGVHEDQEGFYVIAGEGVAKVGEQQFPVRPGSAWLVPKGTLHSLKKKAGSIPLKVIWSHGAV